MDLRKYIKNRAQMDAGVEIIKQNLLFYQPFILSDDIEVGEGMNQCDRYVGVESIFDLNVYAKGIDLAPRKQPADFQWFHRCNQEYRQIYDFVCEQILRSEEHTSELQSLAYLVCRLLLEKKKIHHKYMTHNRQYRC